MSLRKRCTDTDVVLETDLRPNIDSLGALKCLQHKESRKQAASSRICYKVPVWEVHTRETLDSLIFMERCKSSPSVPAYGEGLQALCPVLRVRHVPLWIVSVSQNSVAIVTIVTGIWRARRVTVVLSSESMYQSRTVNRTRPTDSDNFQIPVPSLHVSGDLYF